MKTKKNYQILNTILSAREQGKILKLKNPNYLLLPSWIPLKTWKKKKNTFPRSIHFVFFVSVSKFLNLEYRLLFLPWLMVTEWSVSRRRVETRDLFLEKVGSFVFADFLLYFLFFGSFSSESEIPIWCFEFLFFISMTKKKKTFFPFIQVIVILSSRTKVLCEFLVGTYCSCVFGFAFFFFSF